MNPAVQHIIENSNLFGFGSQESALLQSFKGSISIYTKD